MRDNSDRSAGNGLGVGRRELLRAMTGAGLATAGAFVTSVARAEGWGEGDEQCRVQQIEATPPPELSERQLEQFISVSETLTGAGKRPSRPPLMLQRRLAAEELE